MVLTAESKWPPLINSIIKTAGEEMGRAPRANYEVLKDGGRSLFTVRVREACAGLAPLPGNGVKVGVYTEVFTVSLTIAVCVHNTSLSVSP